MTMKNTRWNNMGVRISGNEKDTVSTTWFIVLMLVYLVALCVVGFTNQNEINKLRVELRQATSDVAEMKKMLNNDLGMEEVK